MASNVVISEFMALNNSGLGGMTDSFGNKSDWIEVHNNGVSPVDLAGWKLEDGSTMWTFPNEPTWVNSVLPGGGYLTVFASGQDTVTLGGTQLHTNFKLSGDGEYLGLLRPDNSIAYEYAPQFPPQIGDVSYGITETSTTSTLVDQCAAAQVLVPTSASQLDPAWNTNGFDASGAPWASGTTGVGFQTVSSPGTLNETEPNNTVGTANSAVNNFGPVTPTQYQLTFTGTAGGTQDWFKIGAMQSGDVLTITASGASSIPANTATDVDIQLWRAGSGSAVKTDADNGPGNDPLVDHFSATTADTYYVMIQRKSSTTGGTYNVNAWLDNAGAAPTTGGSFSAEAESNDTLATANDASTSWRAVGYQSRTAGTITSGDIDVFQYQLTAGDLLSVNVTASGGLDAKVSLKNAAGTTLVQEDGTSSPGGTNTVNSSLYAFKVPSSGLYYVQVQSSAATTGSYTADVSLSTTTAPPGPVSYTSLIGTNLQSQMQNVNASAFVRVPFNVTDPTAFNSLDLRMKYDDGFVAYLNGVEVARRNAGGTAGTPLAWNAAATATQTSAQAIVFEDIDVSSFLNLLVAGTNVLAIQGLNSSAADGSFLMMPSLLGGQDTVTGETFFSPPTPAAANANQVTGQVAAPTVDQPRGFYNSAFYATLADTTPGAQIRYTLDGSVPTATTGIVYTSPVSINQTSTLRFAAFKSGYVSSAVDTETYLFLGSGGAGNHSP
ncbi:MAG TPA: chitobiase/beta-hexosaminidase C-terminal domain-containing protein, partial [Pirellulales bacterium]